MFAGRVCWANVASIFTQCPTGPSSIKTHENNRVVEFSCVGKMYQNTLGDALFLYDVAMVNFYEWNIYGKSQHIYIYVFCEWVCGWYKANSYNDPA